jgi:metal-responsive CopG/Arc/MetJ family transcriptional regulator
MSTNLVMVGSFGAKINPQLLQEVDRVRGDIPRSRFISRALARYLDDIKKDEISVLGEPITQQK